MLSTIPALIFNERYDRLIYQVEDSFYAALLSKRYLYQNIVALHNNDAYLRLFRVKEYCRNYFGGTERLKIDISIRALGWFVLETHPFSWLLDVIEQKCSLKSKVIKILDIDRLCTLLLLLCPLFLWQTTIFQAFYLVTLPFGPWLSQNLDYLELEPLIHGEFDIEAVKTFVTQHNESICGSKPLIVVVINDLTDPKIMHNKAFTRVACYKSLVRQTSQHYDVVFKIIERHQTVDTVLEQVSNAHKNTQIKGLVIYGHGENDLIMLRRFYSIQKTNPPRLNAMDRDSFVILNSCKTNKRRDSVARSFLRNEKVKMVLASGKSFLGFSDIFFDKEGVLVKAKSYDSDLIWKSLQHKPMVSNDVQI